MSAVVRYILVAALAFTNASGFADSEESGERLFPLFDGWFKEKGIDLPLPYGAGLAYIYMNRDVEVDDVRVSFGDRPPESVSETAEFDVNNSTTLLTARVDAWVLPFLNIYVMAGRTRSDALLRAAVSIPTPGPGGPIETEVSVDNQVEGPLLGGGMTMVFGFRDWFMMADANYGKSDLDLFDGELDVWLFSGRVGRTIFRGNRQWMFWGGAMYIDSERTLSITTDLPLIGKTRIDVDQRPKKPMTLQLGASLSIDKNWNFLVEAGHNFDDAFLLVLSAAYRF
jgi:hypothetical protein